MKDSFTVDNCYIPFQQRSTIYGVKAFALQTNVIA